MADNSDDESSDENSHFNKTKKKQDISLFKDLIERFAEFVDSSLNNNSIPEKKVTSSQPNNLKINIKNDNDKSFQATDADKKYLCQLCKMASTKSGAKSHRRQYHSDLPKYSRIHEAILIEKDTKNVDTSKIIERNKDTRKRHIKSDEKSEVLTKSKSDEKKGNNSQDGRENETPKKRKQDENKDSEKPSIFKCKRCSLSFVSAESIEKHFKECQTLSRSSKICDACGLKFTEDELISHVFKHHVTNKNYKKFCILVVSNVTFVENNYGMLKENVSPSKTSTDITESSEDEFEPKKKLGKAPRQELNTQSKMNTNGTQLTNSNESVMNTQQDNNCNQSTQKCACKTPENTNKIQNISDSQKKNLKTSQKISANTKKDILSFFTQVYKTNSNVTAQNLLKAVNPTKQPFKVISHHPKRRYSYDGFSIDNEKEVSQRDQNGNSCVQNIDTMETSEIQTQIEVRRDINTNNSKISPANSNVELIKKPLKISKNNRRMTYHDGVTFSQSSLTEHCNVQLRGDTSNVGKKTFVTSAEVHSYGEKVRDKRVQIATGKTCAEIRLEKNINVTNITNVNTQTHGAVDVRRKSHTENTSFEPDGEQKHAYTNIANNTQREIDISRIEEDVFKLFKCCECNVYYLSSSACETHMRDHKPKDPADCSKCNDCGFVFTNHSLGKHKKNCPGHNIDKVIVDEYRLVVKDNKVVREVNHVQYDIRRQCDKVEKSISTPGIVNSEITYGSDGKPQNADNSKHDLADNVVEKNTNVTEKDARHNLHNITEDIEQIKDGKGKGKLPNFVKDIEGESNLQSNEMVRLHLSNEEAEATLAETRNTEESFISNSRETNTAVCIEKDKAADVIEETAKITTCVEYNQQNKEVQGVISKEGRCSSFENHTPNKVSDQQKEKYDNNALIPQTSFKVSTGIENNQTSQQVITSPKSAEFLERQGVANDSESVPKAGEESTKYDDSTTEHIDEIAIIKTETIPEDIIDTGEEANMTQNVVEIFDNYFEDQNIVTIIDSDDDSDCEIVYVEKKRNRTNTKQKMNHMITYADELSDSSERTMILEYEDNHAYSLSDFIKSEL